ncbi:hypothetical protein KYJ26_16590 [Bacillus sp. MCCB 382]|uniref:hypothetical protein n=1 Tax=Bacillus sp. MCCB 382 TaxID=2860197 RepID=UPI001C55A250|nr:hypothetical protein [Bacillus sp. MCCB 382]
MAKEIVNKSVSFNVLDPFQRQLKSHCDRYPNFSGYIKRLIQRDMETIDVTPYRKEKTPAQPVTNRVSLTSLNGIKL